MVRSNPDGFTDIDSDSGQVRWSLDVDFQEGAETETDGGTVYFLDDQGMIVALDLMTGSERTRFPLLGADVRGTIAAEGGVLYVGSSDGTLFAVSPLKPR